MGAERDKLIKLISDSCVMEINSVTYGEFNLSLEHASDIVDALIANDYLKINEAPYPHGNDYILAEHALESECKRPKGIF